MTTGEDQPKALVGNLLHVISQAFERAQLLGLSRLDSSNAFSSQPIDCLVACRENDPARGIVRDPTGRPGAQGLHEGLLDSLFSQVEAAGRSNQGRDRPSRLAPEQEVEILTWVARGVSLPVGRGSPERGVARSFRSTRRDTGHLLLSPRRGLRPREGNSRRAAPSSPQMVHR